MHLMSRKQPDNRRYNIYAQSYSLNNTELFWWPQQKPDRPRHRKQEMSWRSSLLNVGEKQGTGIGSDHSLVLEKIKLKLRKSRRKIQRPPPINTQKLKDCKVRRTVQLKVQTMISLLMANSNKIDIETFMKYC